MLSRRGGWLRARTEGRSFPGPTVRRGPALFLHNRHRFMLARALVIALR
jgi:hypothetical protein